MMPFGRKSMSIITIRFYSIAPKFICNDQIINIFAAVRCVSHFNINFEWTCEKNFEFRSIGRRIDVIINFILYDYIYIIMWTWLCYQYCQQTKKMYHSRNIQIDYWWCAHEQNLLSYLNEIWNREYMSCDYLDGIRNQCFCHLCVHCDYNQLMAEGIIIVYIFYIDIIIHIIIKYS